MKKNEDKNTKKIYSYINSQNANNNKEIKDKKINGEKKDNMVIITRKEEKIYVIINHEEFFIPIEIFVKLDINKGLLSFFSKGLDCSIITFFLFLDELI